jgi:threonine/homoserine/homoserine lactone efflux protein
VIGPAIADVLPLAVGVLVSPIPIIAIILMLLSPRAHSNGPAFLVGWIVGLGVVSVVAYAISNGADVSGSSGASDSTSVLKMVLGGVLVLIGFRQWRKRPAHGQTAPMPKWMAALDRITPVRAFGLGVALSAVNPKNLILTVGAATTVAQNGVSTGDAVIVLAVFVAVASLSIAAPVAVDLIAGDRAQRVLDTWKGWLEQNNATVMAVLLVVIGVVLFAKGLGPITS